MELKEQRERRQEKSQGMAVLSGLEHTVLLQRAPVSARLSLSSRGPAGLPSNTQKEENVDLGAQSSSREGQTG